MEDLADLERDVAHLGTLLLCIARKSIEPSAVHTDCSSEVERQRWAERGTWLSKNERLTSVLCSH